MPEGDTLHRTAAGLGRVLVGRTVTGFRSPVPLARRRGEGLEGTRIDTVEAVGKHLLVRFSDGRVLRTHLRMTGSWHLYRPGEPWQKPEGLARIVIETDDAVAVCFNAPEVEILTGAAAERGGAAGDVGPDILDPAVDLADVVAAWRSRPEHPVGVTLMRQHLASGIGNIYKSEVLFLCGVDPFAATGTLGDHVLADLARVARREMSANLGPGVRTTRPGRAGGRYWVYKRSGRPCLRCRTTVRMRRQGPDARSTYYCPRCQKVDDPSGGARGS